MNRLYIIIPRLSFADIISKLAVFTFFVFIAFGNLFRFVNVSLFSDNVLASEGTIYLICAVLFFFVEIKAAQKMLMAVLSIGVLFSCFYGSIYSGFELKAFIYALRLVCMLWSGVLLGSLFFKKFQDDINAFLAFFLKAYLAALVLGLGIYFLFPSAGQFWEFLSENNIVFHGDPHSSRFVSVYFDPNFYAAIACIPFLISVTLFGSTRSMKYLLYAGLFGFSILLTWSRSGFATFLLVLAIYLVHKLNGLLRGYFRRLSFFLTFVLLLSIPIIIYFNNSAFEFFTDRVINILEDGSAFARWETFKDALSVIQEYPCWGVGYNYLACKEVRVDSSILLLLASFGIIPFIAIFGSLAFFLVRGLQKSFCMASGPLASAYRMFCGYLAVIVFFSSFFNNLLFYQFWLIPVLVLFTYFSLAMDCQNQNEV